MPYRVKEIFYSLQGEGVHAGRPAVFCRFAGCNLWSGREEDRGTAICRFCDTDFVGTDGPGGGSFASAVELVSALSAHWPVGALRAKPFVVCTGGEPLLQLDREALDALRAGGWEIAVETNGTLPVPGGVDWICVSPKANAPLRQTAGDELKLVFPQEGADPQEYAGLAFEHFLLQPRDGPARDAHMREAAAYCLAHPPWRLSLQLHKILGLP